MAKVVLISLSGVMSPGPLFAITLAEGERNKLAGINIALGHATVEIPLILALFFFGKLIETGKIKGAISLLGGVVLLYLAYLELKSSDSKVKNLKGFVAGALMSALNPYFIIWWLTVGFTLIMDAVNYGLLGLVVFIVLHEFCDFSFLSFVSLTSNKASKIWGRKAKTILTTISVSILTIFGFLFIYNGIKQIL